MINTIKKFFGIGPKVDYAELVKKGAIIIDVRNKEEFGGGHIKVSINIPLDHIGDNFSRLKDKNQVIITCCASGIRSASAKNILKSNGYTNVYNGGGWHSLNQKIK